MHRTSLATPELVPLVTPVDYQIRTYPFDKTLDAGSSLSLTLAGYDGSTTPAGTLFTAGLIDGTLTLPVADESCGLAVAQTQEPDAPVPACPAG